MCYPRVKILVHFAEVLPLEDLLDTKSTPVGPVAGGIMGCFLVLALAVYCYRHHVHRTMAHQFVSSVPDTQVRMSHLDEVEDLDHHEDPGAGEWSWRPCETKTEIVERTNEHFRLILGHANVVLASFENALNMSPYRVNTGYRRPAGGDSDHGYSTMTPHEDTEPVPYVEPLLVGREKYRPPQSVTSSSRTSSPVPHPLSPPPPPPLSTHLGPLPFATGMSPLLVDAEPPQTVIPDASRPHHVLASVQVHMVDTR